MASEVELLTQQLRAANMEIDRLKQKLRLKDKNDKLKKSHPNIYKSWLTYNAGCKNTNHPNYYYYGAKGIKMCLQWEFDFSAFCDYIVNELGERKEGDYLIRVNKSGDVCPGNLKWGTRTEGKKGVGKKVFEYALDGNLVETHSSIKAAADKWGVSPVTMKSWIDRTAKSYKPKGNTFDFTQR